MTFVRDARFDRMGAFAYSEEEGTYAAEHYTDDVPEDVKQKRLDRLMLLQEDIATELSEEKVGETLRVIIDREAERPLTIGNFYQVEITDSEEFDLFGVVRWFF